MITYIYLSASGTKKTLPLPLFLLSLFLLFSSLSLSFWGVRGFPPPPPPPPPPPLDETLFDDVSIRDTPLNLVTQDPHVPMIANHVEDLANM